LLDSLLQENTMVRNTSCLPVYTTITCQTISPGGDFYAASSDDGDVCVWKVDHLLADLSNKPIRSWRAADGSPVYSLTSTDRFLITGGRGELRGWEWNLIEGSTETPSWSIRVGDLTSATMINWMDSDKQGGLGERLVVGCGDGNVYVYDLETRELQYALRGHQKFVHSVAAADGSGGVAVISGGEDGAVKLWDTRKSNPEIYSFLPHTEAELSRPSLGTFISSVSTAGDWMVCGGGPAASLWNLSTRIMSSKLPPDDGSVFATHLVDDKIFVAAQNQPLLMSNFGGESCSEMSVRSSCVYSLAVNQQKDVVAVAGASSTIDIFSVNKQKLLKSLTFPNK